jgi:hypothetical protein
MIERKRGRPKLSEAERKDGDKNIVVKLDTDILRKLNSIADRMKIVRNAGR